MSGLSVMYFTCDTNKKNQESKGERYNNFSKYNNNIKLWYVYCRGFPGVSVVKNLPANAGHMASIPGSGITPREGNGNQLQYSCLRNPMDRAAWQATVYGVTNSQTRLNN